MGSKTPVPLIGANKNWFKFLLNIIILFGTVNGLLDVVPLQVADTKRIGLCIEPLSNYDLKSKKCTYTNIV